MASINLDENFINRYKQFLKSNVYTDIPDFSKSEYWQDHSQSVKINVNDKSVALSGKSGFYIPPKTTSVLHKIKKKLLKPDTIKPYVKKKLGIPEKNRRFQNFDEAFDLVMSSDPIAAIDMSPYRINYQELLKAPGIFKNMAQVTADYKNFTGYVASTFIIKAYYYYNVLIGKKALTSETRRILEIGGGNGNFITLIKRKHPNTTIVDIDLCETLSHAIPFIAECFPKAKILMPHEAVDKSKNFDDYDFVFLTPGQTDLIPDNYFDLAMNSHSFQEMKMKQVEEYFKLCYRSLKNDAFFFVTNRVEKIPGGDNIAFVESQEPPIRFFEFPWKKDNKTLVYEICKFMRMIYPDDCYIRIDQIKK